MNKLLCFDWPTAEYQLCKFTQLRYSAKNKSVLTIQYQKTPRFCFFTLKIGQNKVHHPVCLIQRVSGRNYTILAGGGSEHEGGCIN